MCNFKINMDLNLNPIMNLKQTFFNENVNFQLNYQCIEIRISIWIWLYLHIWVPSWILIQNCNGINIWTFFYWYVFWNSNIACDTLSLVNTSECNLNLDLHFDIENESIISDPLSDFSSFTDKWNLCDFDFRSVIHYQKTLSIYIILGDRIEVTDWSVYKK